MKSVPLICSMIASFIATSVLVAYMPYEAVITWIPGGVSTKWSTAVLGFLCAVALGITSILKPSVARDATSASIASFAGTAAFIMLISSLGDSSWISSLPYADRGPTVQTVATGVPSIIVLSSFTLLMLSALGNAIHSARWKVSLPSTLVVVMATVATLGYVFHAPEMYGYFNGFSTAVAAPSVALMFCLGIGWLMVGKIERRSD